VDVKLAFVADPCGKRTGYIMLEEGMVPLTNGGDRIAVGDHLWLVYPTHIESHSIRRLDVSSKGQMLITATPTTAQRVDEAMFRVITPEKVLEQLERLQPRQDVEVLFTAWLAKPFKLSY
jgi:hypothetical protein